eukprot:TRINITY_DN16572_c0_g1_i3.p1 TRINITY_DN16572_c0_g1~~TRINITY_DN16572_c0_g1_i3.p1  ORF type:complete len:112 (-),score=29.57 TRINITY_DN16572_c0_g1_i3:217-552(-)
MIRRPPRSTLSSSSAASDVYKRQPQYWWNREVFLGPAVLLQSYRWLIEPLDRDFDNRLNLYEHGGKVNFCHNIFNCSVTCPKYLNPGLASKEIKRLVSPGAPNCGPAKNVE